jgi:hypothetical protein
MDNFSIIQALCRSALANPSPAIRKQVERLRDALNEQGEKAHAAALSSLLNAIEKTKEITPSRIVRSRAETSGEVLTPNTPVPVDRETAVPLAQIIFPSEINITPPLFNGTVQTAIETIIEEWVHAEELSAIGVQPPKTALIYGAPGTGKTRLALWIAQKLEVPIVLAKIDGLVSSFLGTTARNMGALFGFANRYRCLLLLDEFDALAKLRDDPQEVGEIKRVVNALLQSLDARQDVGLTIGITNHPNLLDPAVWRRFEVQLEIPKPDFSVRISIARHFISPLEIPESHLKLLSWFTEGATGAEIETLVRTYKKSVAMHGDSQRGLLETLKQFATLNSGRIRKDRRELVFGSSAVLFTAIKDDPLLAFSLAEIGEIAGKDKSTISRMIARSDAKIADQ